MHELGIATELYRICRVEMRRRGGGHLRGVTVEVGELSGVEPELLRYAWEALTAGGADDGAALAIVRRDARQTCERCGPVPGREPGTWLRLCPRCGGPMRVEGGDELDVRQIEFTAVTAAPETMT